MDRDIKHEDVNDHTRESTVPFRLWKYCGFYTLLFLPVFILSHYAFFDAGNGFIWRPDGCNLQFPQLVNTGRFYREIISNILNGSFIFPLADQRFFNTGGNTFAATAAYFGDIFNLPAVFFSYDKTESLYNALVVLRMYCAGFSFLYLCRHFKLNGCSGIAGALSYAFCAYALFYIPQQPPFGSILSFLPLLFIGIDKILLRKSPVLFIASVFIVALSGYYFLVLSGLSLFVFAVIRVHYLYPENFFKQVLFLALKSTGYLLIGITMAAPLFLPSVIMFFCSTRSTTIEWLYPIFSFDTYMTVFLNLFNIQGASYRFLGGITALGAYAAISLFFQPNRRDKHVLFFVMLLLLFYSFPNGHMIAHGMNYPTSRWQFQIAFAFAFVIAYRLPRLFKISLYEILGLFALPAIYLLIMSSTNRKSWDWTSISLILLFMTLVFLALPAICAEHLTMRYTSIWKSLLSLVFLVNIIINAWSLYGIGDRQGYSKQFLQNGLIYSNMNQGMFQWPEASTSENFFRIDTGRISSKYFARNLVYPFYGVEYYHSLVLKSMSDYLRVDLENAAQAGGAFFVNGFDSRAAMHALMTIKFAAIPASEDRFIPWGFSIIQSTNHPNSLLLRNNFFVPPIFTYDKTISYQDFSDLNPVKKQEVIMQAAVVNAEQSNAHIDELSFSSREISPEFSFLNTDWKKPYIETRNNKGILQLHYSGIKSSETYIRFHDFFSLEAKDSFGAQLRNRRDFTVSSDGRHKSMFIGNPNFQWPMQTNFLVNLGYSKESSSDISITFPTKGRSHLEDIQVFCYPMSAHEEYVKKLQAGAAKNILVKGNSITCDVDFSAPKYLYFAFPFDEGWSATVDGVDTPILRANTAFMALKLEKGAHSIELRYFTPGLFPGICLSVLGFSLFILLFCIYRRSKVGA